MSTFGQDKLLSLLAEILYDIRQIKSELQALRTHQQQMQSPPVRSDDNYTPEPVESGRSASPEEVLRYLRETRGEDETGD